MNKIKPFIRRDGLKSLIIGLVVWVLLMIVGLDFDANVSRQILTGTVRAPIVLLVVITIRFIFFVIDDGKPSHKQT